MSKQENKVSAICNFIMKICTLERFIEVKRQMLCDKTDFEPYVAFQRLTRSASSGISAANLQRFLSENLIDVNLERCMIMHTHYDNDKDGLFSYKEFLDIVLPKEHPDLRAFVTQRECYDIKEEEYLSYETEAAMAVLLERELAIFEEALPQKDELDNLALSGPKIIEIVNGSEKGNLNFNNLQKFLFESGLIPYDSEIINFLRRVDRDDDGVITAPELDNFLSKFVHSETALDSIRKRKTLKATNEVKLKTFSPGRSIVAHQLSMISPSKANLHNGGLERNYKIKAERVSMFENVMGSKRNLLKSQSIINLEKKFETTNTNGVLTESRQDTNVNVTRVSMRGQPSLHKNNGTQSMMNFDKKENKLTTSLHQRDMLRTSFKPSERDITPTRTLTKIHSTSNLAFNRSKGRLLHTSKYSFAAPNPIAEEKTPVRNENNPPVAGRPSFHSFGQSSNFEDPSNHNSRVSKALKTYDPNAFRKEASNRGGYQPSKREIESNRTIYNYEKIQNKATVKVYKPAIEEPELTPQKTKEDIPRVSVSLKKETYDPTPPKNRKSYKTIITTSNANKTLNQPQRPQQVSQNNQMNKHDEIFSTTLANIIEEEKILEDTRKKLATRIDFFPTEIFKLLDKRNRGKFTFEEFRGFLSAIGVIHTDTRSLIDLYSYFDSNQNCLLGLNEFNLMIAPHDPMAAVNFDRIPGNNFKGISNDTLKILADCFNRLFSTRKTIIRGKKILKENDIDLNSIFEEIDSGKKGYLEKNDFTNFLKKFSPEFQESGVEEIGLFVNRCDLDRDTRINFKDFYMFFTM